MRRILFESLMRRPLTEAPPAKDEDMLAELGASVERAARRRLGRSLSIREVDAGSCNGCELEIHALNNAGNVRAGRTRSFNSRCCACRPLGVPGSSCFPRRPCAYRKLDSAIVVMQAAEERMRLDASDLLNRARVGRVLVQRPMRSHIVVIAGIGLQNPA